MLERSRSSRAYTGSRSARCRALRSASLYPDDVIAGILNRQGRKTATGERFNAGHVGNLRRYRKIPRFEPPVDSPVGEPVTLKKASEVLGIAPSTIHRWLNDGFIAGEQLTPGAPWRIRITDELRALANKLENEIAGRATPVESLRHDDKPLGNEISADVAELIV